MPTALTVVVPTFNEKGNVEELARRVAAATSDYDTEIVFVDDSTDDTPAEIERVARAGVVPIRLIHRAEKTGGLSGAVLEGIRGARSEVVVVMDGDLQHPPEMVPVLAASLVEADADIAVASRYMKDGDAGGLAGVVRRAVSSLSTVLTRSMFPSKLRDCSDPMTGFFAVQRSHLDLSTLQPRGFKILLEIIARQPSRPVVVEEPFVFGERFAGESKASFVQGIRFLAQLFALRFGRMSGFALVGAAGAVANIALVALLTSLQMPYMLAALIAAEATILGNFVLLERFVFRDLAGSGWGSRLWKSLLFNNVEAAVRLPVLYVIVDLGGIASVPATALTLAVAFLVRFVFHSRVVYAPGRSVRSRVDSVPTTLVATEAPLPPRDTAL